RAGVSHPVLQPGVDQHAQPRRHQSRPGEQRRPRRMSTTGKLPEPPHLPEVTRTGPAVNGGAVNGGQAETRTLLARDYYQLGAHARAHGLAPGDALLAAVVAVLATWARHPAFTVTVHHCGESPRWLPVEVDLALPFDTLAQHIATHRAT